MAGWWRLSASAAWFLGVEAGTLFWVAGGEPDNCLPTPYQMPCLDLSHAFDLSHSKRHSCQSMRVIRAGTRHARRDHVGVVHAVVDLRHQRRVDRLIRKLYVWALRKSR